MLYLSSLSGGCRLRSTPILTGVTHIIIATVSIQKAGGTSLGMQRQPIESGQDRREEHEPSVLKPQSKRGKLPDDGPATLFMQSLMTTDNL